MSVQHFTDDSFKTDVLESDVPTLVDFTAAWCGPCKMLAPVVEELANEYSGRVNIGKVDVDECPNTAMRFGIRSVPTLLFFRNGEVVDKVQGAVGRDALVGKLEATFALGR